MKISTYVPARSLVMGVCLLSIASCANMTDTQRRTLTGAGAGAAVGAVGASVTGGNAVGGAALGAGAGAIGGYIYDQSQKKK